jgi:Trypsin-like peptidase domain
MRKPTLFSRAIIFFFIMITCSSPAWSQRAGKDNPAAAAIASLQAQVQEQANRLEKLEREGNLPSNALRQAGAGVGLIVGEYIWTDPSGRQPIRYQGFDEAGNLLRDEHGNEQVGFNGRGPIVVREFQVTAFLVDPHHLLTSGYLLSPWRSDPLLDESENPLVIPSIRLLHAYFPGVKKALDVDISGAMESGNAVMCSVSGNADSSSAVLHLADSQSVETGEPIVLLGYPGGIQLLLSRVPDELRQRLYKFGQPASDEAAQMLAENGFIQPLALLSRVSGQTEDRVFFETAGNYGNTGGPLIDASGRVVGMSESVHTTFPTFNMGILTATLKPWIERRHGSEDHH